MRTTTQPNARPVPLVTSSLMERVPHTLPFVYMAMSTKDVSLVRQGIKSSMDSAGNFLTTVPISTQL